MKRSKLNVVGHSSIADQKKEIQALLRQIVMIRDGGCILRNLLKDRNAPWAAVDLPPCNGYNKNGELIYQADHLITRGNSATFADPRLVVCVCKGHHGWKSVGNNLRKDMYDAILRAILPKKTVDLWNRCEKDSWRATPKRTYDWKLAILALKQELLKLQTNDTLRG